MERLQPQENLETRNENKAAESAKNKEIQALIESITSIEYGSDKTNIIYNGTPAEIADLMTSLDDGTYRENYTDKKLDQMKEAISVFDCDFAGDLPVSEQKFIRGAIAMWPMQDLGAAGVSQISRSLGIDKDSAPFFNLAIDKSVQRLMSDVVINKDKKNVPEILRINEEYLAKKLEIYSDDPDKKLPLGFGSLQNIIAKCEITAHENLKDS